MSQRGAGRRRRRLRPRACLALLLVLGLPGAAAWGASSGLQGSSVVAVVEAQRAAGLNVIYSDRLLPDSLLVQQEPAATEPVALLREILAPHGLALRRVPGGAWAVVAADRTRRSSGVADGFAVPARPRLDEIVITASQYTLLDPEPGSHTFLTQEELHSLPRLADDTLKAVHRLPGAASNGFSGLAYIRGGADDETLVMLDGMPLAEPFHLRNVLSPVSVLDSRIVGAMDVYSGGYTAEYGDRMSAVVTARSADPPEERYRELALGLFHTGGLAAGRFDEGNGDWLFAARRSNLDEIGDLARNERLGDIHYFDSFARSGYTLPGGTRADLHLLLSRDRIRVSRSRDRERSSAEYRNAYLWGTLSHAWSEAFSGRAMLSVTDVNSRRGGRVEESGRSGLVDDQRKYEIFGLRADFSHESARLLQRWGADLRWLQARYTYRSELSLAADFPFPGDPAEDWSRELRPKPRGSRVGLWTSSRLLLSDRLSAEAGLRWDDQGYDGIDAGSQLSPRLNLAFDLAEHTRLRASWGRFFQAQGIEELQVEDAVGEFQRAQKADHAILGIEHRFGSGLRLRAEAYTKRYRRPITRYENLFDPLVLVPELQPDRVSLTPSHAAARGVELFVSQRYAGPWSWWLVYAWSRATDRIDGRSVPRSWDQTHTVNAGLTHAGERWDFTLATSHHTGWPRTRASLDETDSVRIGLRNADRYRSFRSLDLRLGRRFALESGELTAYLEVINLFAQRNPCCTEYRVTPAPEGGLQLESTTDYWPRLVPSVGVLWKF